MPLPRATTKRVGRLSRPSLGRIAIGCALAVGPSVPLFAASVAATPQTLVTLGAGTQQELVFDKGVDRIALANEAVAGVTVTRKTPGSPAARLILTGKAPGSTTLMVWEKGRPAATIYVLEVQRRDARLDGTLDSVPAYQQAREAALASQPEKAVVSDRSVVNVRSHTVQVEVKVVEFKSCPTRYEPGAGLAIPTGNEPGSDAGGAVGRLMGSLPARRVDHRSDGDRHERSAGAHRGAGAAGVGGDAGAAV